MQMEKGINYIFMLRWHFAFVNNVNKTIFKAKRADTCPDGEVWTQKRKKNLLLRFQSGILLYNCYFVEAFKSHTACFVTLFKSTWMTLADIATQWIQLLCKLNCLPHNKVLVTTKNQQKQLQRWHDSLGKYWIDFYLNWLLALGIQRELLPHRKICPQSLYKAEH